MCFLCVLRASDDVKHVNSPTAASVTERSIVRAKGRLDSAMTVKSSAEVVGS